MRLFDASTPGNEYEDVFCCTECNTAKFPTVEFEDPNGDPFVICLDCLKKAIELASPSVSTPPMHLEAFDGLFDAHD